MRKSNKLTVCQQWQIKAYGALKHIGELPEQPESEQLDMFAEQPDEPEQPNAGGGDVGVDLGGGEDAQPQDDLLSPDAPQDDDPLATLLHTWLGNGSTQHDCTQALRLQANFLFSPAEQMKRDVAARLEEQLSRKPGKHPHCELGVGLQVEQVARFGINEALGNPDIVACILRDNICGKKTHLIGFASEERG